LSFQSGEVTGTSTKIVRGLSEFLAKPPMYYNYLYGIYKYARVLGVELEIVVASTGADASRFAVGRLPYSDTSGITYAQFSEMPDVVSTIVSAKGGLDKWSFKKFYKARDANGNVLTDHSYWVNSAQAISSTPLHNDDYVLMIMSDGVGLTSAASVLVKLHYHIEWFEMQYAV
jgi:hypothetical protein